jgi:hypothetical protein
MNLLDRVIMQCIASEGYDVEYIVPVGKYLSKHIKHSLKHIKRKGVFEVTYAPNSWIVNTRVFYAPYIWDKDIELFVDIFQISPKVS